MSKFKVGDKVKVVKRSVIWSDGMDYLLDNVYKVREIRLVAVS